MVTPNPLSTSWRVHRNASSVAVPAMNRRTTLRLTGAFSTSRSTREEPAAARITLRNMPGAYRADPIVLRRRRELGGLLAGPVRRDVRPGRATLGAEPPAVVGRRVQVHVAAPLIGADAEA